MRLKIESALKLFAKALEIVETDVNIISSGRVIADNLFDAID